MDYTALVYEYIEEGENDKEVIEKSLGFFRDAGFSHTYISLACNWKRWRVGAPSWAPAVGSRLMSAAALCVAELAREFQRPRRIVMPTGDPLGEVGGAALALLMEASPCQCVDCLGHSHPSPYSRSDGMPPIVTMDGLVFSPGLTKPDSLILRNLAADIRAASATRQGITPRRHHVCPPATNGSAQAATEKVASQDELGDADTLATLSAMNDPKDARFEPTVFSGTDINDIRLPEFLDSWILRPYIRMARSFARVETDVVMITHLLLYFTTSVPSAAFLYWHFTWVHGFLHFIMQVSYIGSYTLMMHQHIHMRGILCRQLWAFDMLFPYITDPLMGHSWNSYYYHHVKHHHVEGNGPNDLSSTVRYQRDSLVHFLHYFARFFFLIWLDLPLYFLRKGRTYLAAKMTFWEIGYYGVLYGMYQLNHRATLVVFILPLLLLRSGLMLGNWGQHAFVDHDEPNSDYRSSITLIDVPSNRYSFNDGYHTSHHLNPLRHWREHPVSFIKDKGLYAAQQALVFHNIDYLMITVRLLMKDYHTLAKCMVPIGDQIQLTLDERVNLLKRHTMRFSEEEIRAKFK
ncbi:fatty acid desaturase [Cordyceps militaris CM01]|uniref:Fatty acid desaturase n=1 Tax=Cordyceps militaris (strain CM01) TaxID=983644 RepID=G3JUE8_CORMM|nr:fatty acid desaturase [Cordyceps militaris CM01]EGX87922.1 fatty acid desaturase [Cordyceps militaris CM01]